VARPDALQLFAICPSSLCQKEAVNSFGPQLGRFLAKFPISKIFKTSCWRDRNLSPDEIRAAQEHLDLLERRGAILRYNPATIQAQANTKLDAVCNELSNDLSYLTGALIEGLDINEYPTVSAKLYSFQSGFQPPHHSKIFVDYDAKSLVDVFRTAIRSSDVFKIIDPYIFEINSPIGASSRMKFVEELILELENFDQNRPSDKVIEIYGREDKIFNVEALKGHLRNCPTLRTVAQKYEVRFFGVKQHPAQNSLGYGSPKFRKKKMHDRYFYAGGNVFEVEDTFQDRKETWQQWVRLVDDIDEREFVRMAFSNQSSQYEVRFSFTLEEVFR
jgi:hypothetical protein